MKKHLAINDVRKEMRRAISLYEPMRSPHEGYAILLEEVRELEAEVFTNPKARKIGFMRKEACHVAAMALRFMMDCTEAENEMG